tara:strand:- start:467 stop:1090 length:624 start_codon:yes stop_codon:yes gene_type:complete
MKSKLQVIFPEHFYVDGPYPLVPSERDYALHLKNDVYTNYGGNATSTNSYVLDNEKFKSLKNYIQMCIDEYAYDIMKISRDTKFEITQSWINYNNTGESHHNHKHSNSILSGVFYIEGDGDCPIVFHRDDSRAFFGGNFEYSIEEYNILNSRTWVLPNKKNHLVLFPSTISHSVNSNDTNKERVSLSFNTFIRGYIGQSKRLTELKI